MGSRNIRSDLLFDDDLLDAPSVVGNASFIPPQTRALIGRGFRSLASMHIPTPSAIVQSSLVCAPQNLCNYVQAAIQLETNLADYAQRVIEIQKQAITWHQDIETATEVGHFCKLSLHRGEISRHHDRCSNKNLIRLPSNHIYIQRIEIDM